ncbi:MAG: FHA domain-containing protein [Myxococcota bacterium]
MAKGLSGIIAEAKRRRVFRTAGVYLVAVWGISQGAVELAPLFGAPDWALRWGLIGAVGFLPFVVILAWMFDIGRSGIVRDPQDLLAQEAAEAELAEMPTILGGEEAVGSVIVRWSDSSGENASLFLDEFFIGRGNDCRVRVYDPLVSRKHARVYHEQGGWLIEDLGSRNGTLVDDARVETTAVDGKHEVRVNEAGPVLVFEHVPAGAPTRDAISTFPMGQPVAHVRPASLAQDQTRGMGVRGTKP